MLPEIGRDAIKLLGPEELEFELKKFYNAVMHGSEADKLNARQQLA